MTGPSLGDRQPGWYHDSEGLVRWWNGTRWDDSAPAPGPVGYPPAPGAPPYNAPPTAGWPPPQAPYPPQGVPGYGPAGYGSTGYAMPGAYGTAAPGRSDARTMALFAHLGVFVGGFIVPLIIYATIGNQDPFVRHHASEALNFSLTYLLFALVGMILSLVTLGIGFIVFFPLLMIAVVLHIVFAIMGAMKSNAGEWWRYPVNIRFVKGAY